MRFLKQYSKRISLAVLSQVCSSGSEGRRSERVRKTDLTQIAKKRQMWESYDRT